MRLLEDLPFEDLQAGLVEAARSCKRFPTPADIREASSQRDEAVHDLEAEAALSEIDDLIDKWGADRTPFFRGPSCPEPTGATGLALASIGGWRAYATRDQKSAPFMRRDFLAAYKRYSKDASLAISNQVGGGFGDELRKLAASKTMLAEAE